MDASCLISRPNEQFSAMNTELTFTPQIPVLTHQQQTPFENIVGKGEIVRNEQFLLYSQCFLHKQLIVSPFVHIFAIISLFSAELEEPKNGIRGKRLTLFNITGQHMG